MLEAVDIARRNWLTVFEAQRTSANPATILGLIGDLVAAQVALNEALDQMRTDLTTVDMRTNRYGIIG